MFCLSQRKLDRAYKEEESECSRKLQRTSCFLSFFCYPFEECSSLRRVEAQRASSLHPQDLQGLVSAYTGSSSKKQAEARSARRKKDKKQEEGAEEEEAMSRKLEEERRKTKKEKWEAR